MRSRLEDPFSRFDLGVHLNLTQGRPLTGKNYPGELLDDTGRFPGVFTLFARLQRHGVRLCGQIQAELARQVEFLLDHGLQPTHLNGHQYIEMLPVVADFIPQLLARYDIHVVRVADECSLVRSALLKSHSPRAWILARIKQFFARQFHRRMEQLEVHYPARFHGTAHAGKIDMPLIRLFLGDGNRQPTGPVEIGLHPAMETGGLKRRLLRRLDRSVGICPSQRASFTHFGRTGRISGSPPLPPGTPGPLGSRMKRLGGSVPTGFSARKAAFRVDMEPWHKLLAVSRRTANPPLCSPGAK